jgi:catechol 2,3-dioxygenase-like lactoylglutathione lyase family enzyme
MIDHTGVTVSDFEKSKAFYRAALEPIGYQMLMEFPASPGGENDRPGQVDRGPTVLGHADVAGFGVPPKADFWIGRGIPNNPAIHVAFRVKSRAQVDAFYAAALAAGGRSNGAPGPRPHYHADYYGAFVLDPDGHNIETVCHEPA